MKREELKRARRKSNLLLVCILLLQLGMLLFWGNAKTNYYVDELFSMGYAHNFTGAAGDAQYIHTDDSWVINEWTPAAELKEQLVVGEGESVLDIPASQAIRLTVTGRSHHGLLNLAETLLNDGEISKRGGLFLNYLAFLLFQLVLILFLRRLEVDERLVCAAVLMSGFGGLLAGLAQYIRFYMLTCFYVILILHLHLILWQTGKAVPFLAAEAGAGLLFLRVRRFDRVLYAGAAFHETMEESGLLRDPRLFGGALVRLQEDRFYGYGPASFCLPDCG